MSERGLSLCTGEHFLIKGPARLTVKDGSVEVFGALLARGDQLTVVSGRQAPLTAVENSTISVTAGHGGHLEKISYDPIPGSWKEAVREIASHRIVMILGETDTGKSGFVLYIANKLSSMGKTVAVVDTDIGQSDIGPPGTIGLSILPRAETSYSNLPLSNAYFVGDKTPTGHLLPMVVGTKKMVDEGLSRGADLVLVNTTGMVHGGVALALKRFKIEAVEPDLLVALQRRGEIEHILSLFEGVVRILRVEVPRAIKRKEREERLTFRRLKMTRFLENSKNVRIPLNEVVVVNAMHGRRLTDDKIEERIREEIGKRPVALLSDKISILAIFDQKLSREEVMAVRGVLAEEYADVKVDYLSKYRGLVLGLFDSDQSFLGLGLLEALDLRRGEILLRTPVREIGRVRFVYFGYIALDEGGVEKARFKPGSGLI